MHSIVFKMTDKSATRSSKRPRKEDPGDASSDGTSVAAAFERDKMFWLEDGNLILVAGNIGFRVYRGLLATQSEVFRNMVSAAEPAGCDNVDGCPVVSLSDSPENVRHLLGVILPTSTRRYVSNCLYRHS